MIREPRRMISAGIAIALGVAFVAATMLLGSSLRQTMRNAAEAQVGGAAVVVSLPTKPTPETVIDESTAAAIAKVPGVTGVRANATSFTRVQLPQGAQYAVVGILPSLSASTTLASGRLPQGAGEAAVATQFAERSKLTPGSVITFEKGTPDERTVTVTGLVTPGREVTGDATQPLLWLPRAQYFATLPAVRGFDELLVSGGNPSQLAAAVAAVPGIGAKHLVVRTHDAEVAQREKDLLHGVDALQNLLLGFAAIAVFVAGLVIANTFSITIAQRTRQLALLRCVGATRRQVFGSVVGEALTLGIASSLVGLGIGVLLALAAIALSHTTQQMRIDALAVSLVALATPLLVGVVMTVIAALLPARSATRVAPMAALRPQLASPATGRAGVARVVAGLVLFGAGLALLIWGASQPQVVVGIGGGLINFVGLMILAPVVIPAAVRIIGAPLRRAGAPAELAVENSLRNPRRAAATAGALIVGVTLITMMSVGAQSAQATQSRAMDRQFPTDATIQAADGRLPAGSLTKITSTQGVSAAVPARFAQGNLKSGTATSTVSLIAISRSDGGIFRKASATKDLADGVILIDNTLGIADGAKVTLVVGGTSTELTAKVDRDHLKQAIVTTATLERMGAPSQDGALVRFTDDASNWTVLEALSALFPTGDVTVQGASIGKAEIEQVIQIVLYLVTGLLAISVLIALVGVANTLGLSIVERTQESGLLRALGLTRPQLRSMIGFESLLIALTAVLLGLVFGVGYGVAGVYALVKGQMTIVIEIPWLRLAVVSGIAVLAAWVASVAPSIRASRVSPAAALATE